MQMNWDLAEAAKDKELVNIVKTISMYKKEAKPPVAKKAVVAKETAGKKTAKTVKKPVAVPKKTVKPGSTPAK
jgi:hypothetical protein